MAQIKLIRKPDARFDITQLVVADDLFAGLLTSEFYVPVITGQDKGMRVASLTHLVENYQFPMCDGVSCTRITDFLQGYPRLYSKLSFYEQTPATV
jgi:hypothetical protein